VFRSNEPKIANFRADYAKRADFCDVLNTKTKPLYLLAFLLTANHNESEQCFVLTVEEAFKEQSVFREWARSWVKRRLVENAIKIVLPVSVRNSRERELWGAERRETRRGYEIDTVAPLERFVFL
jgi:hypothetical protein